MKSGEVACYRCGTRMEHWAEVEHDGAISRKYYYYKCPRCGYRLGDLTVKIQKQKGKGVVLSVEEYIVVKRR